MSGQNDFWNKVECTFISVQLHSFKNEKLWLKLHSIVFRLNLNYISFKVEQVKDIFLTGSSLHVSPVSILFTLISLLTYRYKNYVRHPGSPHAEI